MKFDFGADCPDFSKLAKKEKKACVRVRILAMAQLKDNGSIGKTAKSLHVNRHSVGEWFRSFKERGIQGLYDLPRSGAKPKLPKEKEQEFVAEVLALQENKKGGRITGYDIQKMALKKFDANYAEDSIYGVLERLKMSWITGRSKHPKANEAEQKAFKKNFKKKLLRFFRRKLS